MLVSGSDEMLAQAYPHRMINSLSRMPSTLVEKVILLVFILQLRDFRMVGLHDS
jgi:hypothetical protein